MAIESFKNTESGLEQVVQAAKYAQLSPKEQRERLIMAVFGMIVVLTFVFYKFQPEAAEDAASSNGPITMP